MAQAAQSEFELLHVLAHFFLNNARPEKAVALLKALVMLEADHLGARRSLAFAQIRAGQGAPALGTLDQLAMLGNGDEYFHLMRSQALSLLQRRDEAAAAMRAYLSLRKPVTPAQAQTGRRKA